MQDKLLMISDGQTVTTDEDGQYVLNLEDGSVADQMVGPAWLCVRIIAASSLTLTGGLSIHLMTTDTDPIGAAPEAVPATEKGIVSITCIPVAEIIVGAVFCVGFLANDLKKYLGVWFDDEGSSVAGTLTVDVWIQNQPVTRLKIQKMPS